MDCTDKLIVGTRLHYNNSEQSVQLDEQKIKQFVESTLKYTKSIVIAFGGPKTVYQQLLELLNRLNVCHFVYVIDVQPWGNFIPALNTIVRHAVLEKKEFLSFQSLEINIEHPEIIHDALGYMTLDTLMVGFRLQGHEFDVGTHTVTGLRCPWNTLSIFNTKKLAITGFVNVSEGMPSVDETNSSEVPAGVEEICTISVLQLLQPGKMCVKLLEHQCAPAWNTKFDDPHREEWHQRKMKSKFDRAAKQLKVMEIEPGMVEHIKHT